MRKMPKMDYQNPNTGLLSPGETARLSWQFTADDTDAFACNIPGHFKAGMKQVSLIAVVSGN